MNRRAQGNSDEEFAAADAGASKSYPQQCSALRKNGYVVMRGRPCKIVDMSTSKPGKHGHAKVFLVGLDLFSGKRYEEICPAKHNMEVPAVERVDYQVIDIGHDGYVSLLDKNGLTRCDLQVPEGDGGNEMVEKFKKGQPLQVTVLKSMDTEVIVSCKLDTNTY